MNPGIYTDISIDDYHQKDRDYLSATSLKWARKSLAYFDYMRKQPPVTGSHLDFGNAFELALLDVIKFSERVAIAPTEMWLAETMVANKDLVKPRASKIYQDRQKEFEIGRAGMYRIDDTGKESYETIQAMMHSCYRDAVIQRLIKNIDYQTSCYWVDEETGLKLKTRPDICKKKNNVIVNLKTAEDGSPEQFSRDLAKYAYPLQASVEIRGVLKTGLMETVDNYFWLVVEKSEPFNATLYEFSEGDRKYSDMELDYILHKVKKATDSKLWPGYSDRAQNEHGILVATIPNYYKLID
jgi:hypothetical protein